MASAANFSMLAIKVGLHDPQSPLNFINKTNQHVSHSRLEEMIKTLKSGQCMTELTALFADRCFIQINGSAGDSVFAIVFGVFRRSVSNYKEIEYQVSPNQADRASTVTDI